MGTSFHARLRKLRMMILCGPKFLQGATLPEKKKNSMRSELFLPGRIPISVSYPKRTYSFQNVEILLKLPVRGSPVQPHHQGIHRLCRKVVAHFYDALMGGVTSFGKWHKTGMWMTASLAQELLRQMDADGDAAVELDELISWLAAQPPCCFVRAVPPPLGGGDWGFFPIVTGCLFDAY